ncbi:hypothetical protein WJX82_009560 [Trebouxia sp. C0006]
MGVGALVLGFVFLSWCVLVGGLSAVQHRANDRNAFEFEWWIVAFEFFLVLLAAVELTGFRRGHSGLVALKAVNTALIMLYAQHWNNNRRNGAYGAYGVKAVRTTFAGFILLAASNVLLILTLGTEPAHTSSAPEESRCNISIQSELHKSLAQRDNLTVPQPLQQSKLPKLACQLLNKHASIACELVRL